MARTCGVTPPAWSPPAASRETIELEIKVITPLFGGGFEPRETDPVTPIRAAAIRGHLRFWWRATAGARYEESEELFEAEEKIWGSASCESRIAVSVVVSTVAAQNKIPASTLAGRSNPRSGPGLGYFLFPFQGQQRENIPEASGLKNIGFGLSVRAPSEQVDEVKTAMKAWIIFGGVGARTRRGCGSLGPEDIAWRLEEGREGLQTIRRLVHPQVNRPMTILAGAHAVIGQSEADAEAVWKSLARFWARIRKGHRRDDYQPMKGSRWGDHKTLLQLRSAETVALNKPFLGLPLIYQKFQGSFDGTIIPEASGRMASPVILKPVLLASGQFAPLVAVLNTVEPRRVKIKDRARNMERNDADAVLRDFGASNPLDAVIKQAELEFNVPAVVVGG